MVQKNETGQKVTIMSYSKIPMAYVLKLISSQVQVYLRKVKVLAPVMITFALGEKTLQKAACCKIGSKVAKAYKLSLIHI